MNSHATRRFWEAYARLPRDLQDLARKNHRLWLQDPLHPSLHFKKVGRFWSVRIGIQYRALAVAGDEGPVWFWIGTHAEYDTLLG